MFITKRFPSACAFWYIHSQASSTADSSTKKVTNKKLKYFDIKNESSLLIESYYEIIKELITAKIKGRVIRKNMFLRLLSNVNFDYETKDYELVINQLIKDGELKEKDGFIRHKDSEDLTKLFVEYNGVRGIWASKA